MGPSKICVFVALLIFSIDHITSQDAMPSLNCYDSSASTSTLNAIAVIQCPNGYPCFVDQGTGRYGCMPPALCVYQTTGLTTVRCCDKDRCNKPNGAAWNRAPTSAALLVATVAVLLSRRPFALR